jgi:hypothetical protein
MAELTSALNFPHAVSEKNHFASLATPAAVPAGPATPNTEAIRLAWVLILFMSATSIRKSKL